MSRIARQDLIPNANNPRMLTRVLELVATGVSDPKSMAEVLNCELRTIHYYTQAGEWLRLLDTHEKTDRLHLTRMGLEYVFAGKERPRVYARAVWSNDFVVQLMGGRKTLPEIEAITEFIQRWVPDMAAATARRRATAVHSLLAPAMVYAVGRKAQGHQLSLDFQAAARPVGAIERLNPRTSGEHSPDVYRTLIRALLDHGELSLGQLRAVFDAAGGRELAVNDYADWAVQRGDAWRLGGALVASWGAVWRRDLIETVAGVALSDPEYREYLEVLRAASSGDPGAGARYGRLRERFAPWDRRVFGESATPARLAKDLERVLLGRPIDSFPLAGENGPEPGGVTGPFLGLLDRSDLLLCLPPSVLDLRGGVSGVNKLLQRRQQGKNDTGLPGLVDARVLAHGGLCHPGERPFRAIPDLVSLRLRALMHIPHLAMLTALLLLHRRADWRMVLRFHDTSLELWRGKQAVGELLFLLDEFASEQGWLVARRPRTGVSATQLAEVLESLGVATRVHDLLVLDEDFFMRLRHEEEDREVYEDLVPLADRLQQFTEGWSAQE